MIVSFLQQGNDKIVSFFWPWYLDKCDTGSAVGGSEKLLPHLYTVQQCIDVVRSQYHAANGFTMTFPCEYPKKCNCYAVFNMEGWNSDQQLWKTCSFHKGKYIRH